MVRPDISLICGVVLGEYLESPPMLIVEILSASTAHKDRTAKRALYEQEGVEYYLWGDPDSKRLEGCQLKDGRYTAWDPVDGDDFRLTRECQIRPDFGSLFR